MAHPDEQCLRCAPLRFADDVLQGLGGLDGVLGGADRPRIALRAESGRRFEGELRSGCVDEEVVVEIRGLS